MLYYIVVLDILTPLPAMGIDFTMVENKGPKILNPIKSAEDIEKLRLIEDGNSQIPFVGSILSVGHSYLLIILTICFCSHCAVKWQAKPPFWVLLELLGH